MATWYSINLGDAMLADVALERLGGIFQQMFALSGIPADVAVFTRLESEGRLHCEVIAYFSPAAEEVAQAFEAEPCPRPARAGLGLLAGDEHAWTVLFPEGVG